MKGNKSPFEYFVNIRMLDIRTLIRCMTPLSLCVRTGSNRENEFYIRALALLILVFLS
ncbi:hypothetical protein ALO36_102003 [Pseudomonas syringae pv. tomato]|uniref:Uncharacterized protein n=6 Tax=Pseudomonas syringae group TaxID=136849 RepID=A0A0Q0BGD2_PSESX|nr:hypothetical protein ALO87_101197 [Pseudomonas syringae pv. apii]KPY76895.1 hypothetical protein ALO94_100306 [Pseudomonas syringae pv. spinaceae]KPY90524.1 hypothetical protein ALO36_102003 [Pseudomonas syringae pv. tomato]KPZ17225.1 hypothetical protein ALO40_101303 [Pseudomonas syringae pv. viburni]RMM04507.1 hypothetical protein ALQ85_101176 [Pseudomonas syringae]RMO82553.1 hypothetical protein ALQ34_101772 [Pseudomonas syringae pv. maculicola]RMP30543.1 hypothetical protein ALQ24_1013